MPKGRGGIAFDEVAAGKGPIVGPRDCVRAKVAMFLHRGDPVGTPAEMEIDLSKRRVAAGLRYGVEGMRLGGQRRIVCPPHLAYGAEGAESAGVPKDALLIFEVEVVEIVGVPRKAAKEPRKCD